MAALIKEAKQRARRRRWITGGGAAVLVTIAAVAGFAILPVKPSSPEGAARNVPSQTPPSPVGSPLDHGTKKQKQEVTRRCNAAVYLTGPEGREVLVRGEDGAVVPVALMPIPQPVGAVPDRGRTVNVSPEIVAGQEPPVVIRWADHQRVCHRVRGDTQGK